MGLGNCVMVADYHCDIIKSTFLSCSKVHYHKWHIFNTCWNIFLHIGNRKKYHFIWSTIQPRMLVDFRYRLFQTLKFYMRILIFKSYHPKNWHGNTAWSLSLLSKNFKIILNIVEDQDHYIFQTSEPGLAHPVQVLKESRDLQPLRKCWFSFKNNGVFPFC